MSDRIYELGDGCKVSIITKPVEVKVVKYKPVLVAEDGREKDLSDGKPCDNEVLAMFLGMLEFEGALRDFGMPFTGKWKSETDPEKESLESASADDSIPPQSA